MAVTGKCLVVLLHLYTVHCSRIEVLSNASIYINTSSEVYDIQHDLFNDGNLLFSDSRVLVTTEGHQTWNIAGNSSVFSGYREGVGAKAIFYGITSFLQINKTTVLVVDKWNHCIRSVNRLTNQTSAFAGKCTKNGFNNAYSQDAMFFYPTGFLRIGSTIIIADTYNMAVRLIMPSDNQKLFVSTLSRGGILKYPQFIASDSRSNLYITVMDGIVEIPSGSNTPQAMTSLKGGFFDGPIGLSEFYDLKQIKIEADSLLVVVDSGNSRVRVVDMVTGHVTTLVQLDSKMSRSLSITNDKLFVGAYQKILQMDISVEKATPNATTPSPLTATATFVLPTTTASTTTVKAAFTAQYNVDCSMLAAGNDKSVLKAVLAYRFMQLEKVCQSDCRRSTTLKASYKCNGGKLIAYWPVEIAPYTSTNEIISKELQQKMQGRLKSIDLLQFTITILSRTPPVVRPRLVCNKYIRLQAVVADSVRNILLPSNSDTLCS